MICFCLPYRNEILSRDKNPMHSETSSIPAVKLCKLTFLIALMCLIMSRLGNSLQLENFPDLKKTCLTDYKLIIKLFNIIIEFSLSKINLTEPHKRVRIQLVSSSCFG